MSMIAILALEIPDDVADQFILNGYRVVEAEWPNQILKLLETEALAAVLIMPGYDRKTPCMEKLYATNMRPPIIWMKPDTSVFDVLSFLRPPMASLIQ